MGVETIINTIRHGYTSYNAEKRYAGSIDVPLNEKGVEDSRLASEKLQDAQFDVVVASSLKRCIETAQILIGARKIPLILSRLCIERNFGILEGRTWDEVQNLNPPVLFVKVGNDLHSVNPRNGEPFELVWARANRFRRFLFRNHRGKNILVVSHGVFLQMFHGVLRGLSCIESLGAYPGNLEISTFCFRGNRLMEESSIKLASELIKF